MIPARPLVVSVSADAAHRFSKPVLSHIRLVAGHGVEGDAHAGPFVKHRFLARRDSRTPNDRQVHLMESELFAELADEGFTVGPGMLGENVTTRGLDLSRLPLGTRLHLGHSAQPGRLGIVARARRSAAAGRPPHGEPARRCASRSAALSHG